MDVIRSLNNVKKDLQNCSLIIGNFDGLHLGHQKILEFNREIAQKDAKKDSVKTALLTFSPHPKYFFNPKFKENSQIYSTSQKLEKLAESKLIDTVFLAHFNQDLANFEATEFVEKILVNQLKIRNLVIGYDFCFGKNRLGNCDLLEKLAPKYGYKLFKIAAQKDETAEIYSSTNIRNLLKAGNISKANSILGHNYEIKGTVINGRKLGREIGFRTANILPKTFIIKPKFGVYKSLTKIDGKSYNSITNFGVKPTLAGNLELFETHIFDFNQDIYGRIIKIELLDFIRPELKFGNIDELKAQIKKDVELCQDIK